MAPRWRIIRQSVSEVGQDVTGGVGQVWLGKNFKKPRLKGASSGLVSSAGTPEPFKETPGEATDSSKNSLLVDKVSAELNSWKLPACRAPQGTRQQAQKVTV